MNHLSFLFPTFLLRDTAYAIEMMQRTRSTFVATIQHALQPLSYTHTYPTTTPAYPTRLPTHTHPPRSRLNRTPLHLLPALPLPLLLQILALLVRTQPAKFRIPLFALELVGREFALLGLLLLVDFADLGNLLFARLLDAAQGFGAEVGGCSQVVGEAQEVLE
jgi:hypothetical protein